jgi:hypothetical protein
MGNAVVGRQPQQQVFVLALPKDDDPANCFPQAYVAATLKGNVVNLGSITQHTDRKPWLSEGRVPFTVPDQPLLLRDGEEPADFVSGKSGYLDEDGTVAIPPRYDDCEVTLRPFVDGVASVSMLGGPSYGLQLLTSNADISLWGEKGPHDESVEAVGQTQFGRSCRGRQMRA